MKERDEEPKKHTKPAENTKSTDSGDAATSRTLATADGGGATKKKASSKKSGAALSTDADGELVKKSPAEMTREELAEHNKEMDEEFQKEREAVETRTYGDLHEPTRSRIVVPEDQIPEEGQLLSTRIAPATEQVDLGEKNERGEGIRMVEKRKEAEQADATSGGDKSTASSKKASSGEEVRK